MKIQQPSSQHVWLEKRLAISCMLSIPMLAIIACWMAMFRNSDFGYTMEFGALKPFFTVGFFVSWLLSIAGIIYFFVSRKSFPVITCFVVSVANALFGLYGFFWCLGPLAGM